MRRNWYLIGTLLREIEEDHLWQFLEELKAKQSEAEREYLDQQEAGLPVSEKMPERVYDHAIRHLELLADAGYIKNFDLRQTVDGRYTIIQRDVRITMSGYDLKEVINNQKLWSRIVGKAKNAGIAVTCEFVKAMIPEAIRMLIDE